MLRGGWALDEGGRTGHDVGMAELCLLYVPCPDLAIAKSLAHSLLQSKRIACANILPGMVSCYRWQGAIEESAEVLLLLKTTVDQGEEVARVVAQLHPYEVPCVATVRLTDVDPQFYAWAQQQVGSDGPSC